MKFLRVSLLWGTWFAVGLLASIICAFCALYLYLAPGLPAVESITEIEYRTPLRILSKNGELIGEFGDKRRNPLKYEDIPQDYINAVLAAEDSGFFDHSGVSVKGLTRAVVELIKTGEKQTGGSTITMQVARNVYLDKGRRFTRKFREIILALQIEETLSKERILELYANYMFMGKRAYGVEAAALVYYGKSSKELSTAQLAMLAGLYKAPSRYNPVAAPKRAKVRRDWILGRMNQLGFLDVPSYQLALAEPVEAQDYGVSLDLDAGYVAEMARMEAIERYGEEVYESGFSVITTVDSRLQKAGMNALQSGLRAYDARHGYRGAVKQLDDTALTAIQDDVSVLKENQALTSSSTSDLILNQPNGPIGRDSEFEENSKDNPKLTKARIRLAAVFAGLPATRDVHHALVLSTEDQAAEVLVDNLSLVSLTWEQGFKDLRLYRTENQRSQAIKRVSQAVEAGDIVVVEADPNTARDGKRVYRLSQIPDVEGAIVSISPQNGAIQSITGGYDFHRNKYNRATQAERQIGSNVKPFLYAIGLERGMTPATIINDAPIVFEDSKLEDSWRPENSSGRFYGPTRLRNALAYSRNLVSIRVLQNIGIDPAIERLTDYGFDKAKLPRDLSLSLGSMGATPLEVAQRYAMIANGGFYVEPFLIDSVIDRDGYPVYKAAPLTVKPIIASSDYSPNESDYIRRAVFAEDRSPPVDTKPYEINEDPFYLSMLTRYQLALVDDIEPPPAPRIMDARTHYQIDSILKDVIARGTASKAKTLKRKDIAGKTGTTNGPIDAWFSGYTQQTVTTVWVGFDKSKPLGVREYGGSAALPIWIDYMQTALEGQPETQTAMPEGMVSVRIDSETGLRAQFDNANGIFETFKEENLPEFEESFDLLAPEEGARETINEEIF